MQEARLVVRLGFVCIQGRVPCEKRRLCARRNKPLRTLGYDGIRAGRTPYLGQYVEVWIVKASQRLPVS